MSIYSQLLLDIHDELIVDLFAGGGGASCGIEMATGRQVDVAVNHDAAAVAMHQINHPQTRHEIADVFEVCPRVVTKGRPVGLLWASPDCTYHSKARGGKPMRDKNRKRRSLAWVVTRWAGQVRPRVIMLENVEEFADWGPLVGPHDALRPCPKRRGKTFRRWVRSLERHGYEVEWRELRACDYGAPTIRKRLFVIARCDGEPIVWPEPTHGPGTGRRYRSAAECIDWDEPMLSIFATREEAKEWARAHRRSGRKMGTPVRPLADATMRRIARGVKRYVLKDPKPFIVPNNTGNAPHSASRPVPTVTGGGRNILVAPALAHIGNGEREGQAPRAMDIREPLNTVVASPKHALVAAFLTQNNAGGYTGPGRDLRDPSGTVLSTGSHHSLVAAHIQRDFGTSTGHEATRPLGTITSEGGGKAALVASFLSSYYGTDQDQSAADPLATITTKDRHSLVTVEIDGSAYVIVDIAIRMLQPRELYRAQGFPDSYVIDRGAGGRRLTKTEQVRMCGNSVPPHFAAALVRANAPELAARTIAA